MDIMDLEVDKWCKVCKERAAGYHFGAYTCEGCKSFFGRTYNKPPSAIPKCKKGDNCEINKRTRTSCKACRLKRCYLVGMCKEKSRYGRRSNSLKAKQALQERRDIQNEKLSNDSSVDSSNKSDVASTTQRTSANDMNPPNNGLPNNEYVNNQLQIPTSNQATSSTTDNQIEYGSSPEITIEQTLNFLRLKYLMNSMARTNFSTDSLDTIVDNEPRLLDENSSSQVSPFTLTNRMHEPTSSTSNVPVNGSMMFMHPHNPYFNPFSAAPSMITPTPYSVRGGDSLLVSPNPGGLADESDEPMDLSVQASSSSSQPESFNNKRKMEDQINISSSMDESVANPLDLTLAPPPAKFLRSTRRY
ncbi:uncharacterized protein [Anoplolepis gracilipes]|uniref:uncharacterized protein n=1 Tax=Anoplolepis gracilipes TaxID=354296 RepID=UPI003B9F0120